VDTIYVYVDTYWTQTGQRLFGPYDLIR